MKNKIKDHLLAARGALTGLQRQQVEGDGCWGMKQNEKGWWGSQKGIAEDQLYTKACANQLFRKKELDHLSPGGCEALAGSALVTATRGMSGYRQGPPTLGPWCR